MLRLECCCQTITAWCLVLQTTGNTRAAVGVSQCLLRVGLNPPEQEEISFWHLGAPGCEKGIQLLSGAEQCLAGNVIGESQRAKLMQPQS